MEYNKKCQHENMSRKALESSGSHASKNTRVNPFNRN